MKQFGAFYAKTHFSELLEAVSKGKKFLISKHEKPVAMLIPYTKNLKLGEEDSVASAIRAIHHLREGTKLGKDLSIKEMKKVGRA